jgi:PAS domain S-box-containing protein
MLVTVLLAIALGGLAATFVVSATISDFFPDRGAHASHLLTVAVLACVSVFVLAEAVAGLLPTGPGTIAVSALLAGLSLSMLLSLYIFRREMLSRRAREVEIAALGEYYRALFQHAGTIVLLVDPRTLDVVDANAAAGTFYGYPIEHLSEMKLHEISHSPIHDVLAERRKAADEGRPWSRVRHRLANGDVRNVEVYASPVEVRGRALEVWIVHDVTDRTLAERELDTERRLLERRVSERTHELAELVGRLEAASAAKDRFLANVSHELRTPLNSILGYTGVVLGGLAGDLNPEQRKQLGMVDHSARHLLNLVKDLLDVAQLEEGVVHVEPAPFVLADVLDQVGGMMEPLATEKGLLLQVLAPLEPIPMESDRVKLEQVLVNLVSNAVKFTDRGSVTLAAELRSDGTVACVITDTGVGMPQHALDAVTDTFEQVYRRDGMKPAGIGLGLAISKRLALALGGTLRVTSSEGAGSTFALVIPRVIGVSEATPEAGAAEARRRSGMR